MQERWIRSCTGLFLWDVRIGVYNIRRMAGNAIMDGETLYLTEKEAVRTVDCWGPIPQEPAMRSFYLQSMRFFAKCQCAKGKTFRLFPERAGALNACGAFNFAAVLWKFARKSARPPDWFRGGGRKKEAG